MDYEQKPAVLILGGQENALSLVRSLGRDGISVSLSAPKKCKGMYSRYLRRAYVVEAGQFKSSWRDLLLGDGNEELLGSVILTCSDEAIEFVANMHDALKDRYILEKIPPKVRTQLLRKDLSLEVARAAGVATPRSQVLQSESDLRQVCSHWQFPMLLKPVYGHKYRTLYEDKLAVCASSEELRAVFKGVVENKLDVIATEIIPGPDSALCSYYTYLDDAGQPLFHFTKKIIRRYPASFGSGVCHVTQWMPDVAETGLRFLQAAGLRGLGNVEFKLDERDGQLKFIECNARFTAAQEQVLCAGYDLGKFVYSQLSGQEFDFPPNYRENLLLWYPRGDFKAYRELASRGELSFFGWLRSIARPRVYAFFDPFDLKPFLVRLLRRNLLARIKQKLWSFFSP